MERGGRGRARGRGRKMRSGAKAPAQIGVGRTRGRPSPAESFYCGMVEDLPVGQPLERPLTQRRPRVQPTSKQGPVPVALWSSMDVLVSKHPQSAQPQSPQPDRAAEAQPQSPQPDRAAETEPQSPKVDQAALHVKLEGASPTTPRKRRAPEHSDMRAKRRLITSPSSSQRTLKNEKLLMAFNYGSDEDSDEDDEDEIGPLSTIVPRVVQMYVPSEEDDGEEVNAFLCFSWPPTSHDPDSTVSPSISTHTPSPCSSPMSEPVNKFDFKWRMFPNPQTPPELRREPFSQINCGPTVPFARPYDAFTAIWDHDIMEHIVLETNRYAQQLATVMLVDGSLRPNSRISKWRDTDVDELHVYFAIVLATGIVVKTRLEEYWNSTQDIFSTPEFTTAMRYDRFVLLSKCLHFQDNDGCDPETMTRAQAKLFKVQPILDHLNSKFQQLYVLNQNVALDESLTMWKGCLDINQMIRNKAATIGIKTYEICESQTGYLWRFEVHAGHNTSSDPLEDSPVSGIVPTLVLRLLKGLEHKGHTIWMDNFYNSPALARELKVRGFDCVGTLRTNRQFVPRELKNLLKNDMAEGQVKGCTSGDVDLIVYRDKNRVAFISTYHGLATTMCGDTRKPTIVPDYNVCMGGVDRKDQLLAMYPIERRRNKVWYKKFFRRLLNASVLNAYILHKAYTSISHRSFRQTLVRELLAAHAPPAPPRALPVTWHFPGQYDLVPGTARNEHVRRACSLCKKRTSSFCKSCNVALCVFGCFETYHTSQ